MTVLTTPVTQWSGRKHASECELCAVEYINIVSSSLSPFIFFESLQIFSMC